MVLVVVDLHGGGIDVGFEGLEVVREIGETVSVGPLWSAKSNSSCDSRTLLEDSTAGVDVVAVCD